jgi:membrane-associated protease RseP (regulator of RpoE activity)
LRILIALVSFLALSACAGTLHRPQTASGRPEVTIANTTPEKIKPVLVSEMANAGYRITKDTPYELAFDKPVQNLAMAVLLGSRYDAQPNARVTYTFAQIGNDTRVIGDVAVITNPGSAFERRTELNNGVDAYDLQTGLQRLSAAMDPNSPLNKARKNKIVLGIGVITAERAKVAGMSGPSHGLYVTIVKPNSVAGAAGIKKGDVLLRFNNITLANDSDLERAEAAARPGASAKLVVWRSDNTESTVTVQFPRTQRTARKQ